MYRKLLGCPTLGLPQAYRSMDRTEGKDRLAEGLAWAGGGCVGRGVLAVAPFPARAWC